LATFDVKIKLQLVLRNLCAVGKIIEFTTFAKGCLERRHVTVERYRYNR